jgi:hypothetical protein
VAAGLEKFEKSYVRFQATTFYHQDVRKIRGQLDDPCIQMTYYVFFNLASIVSVLLLPECWLTSAASNSLHHCFLHFTVFVLHKKILS